MSKKFLIVVFQLLFIPSTFAFGDFLKKIDDAFENLNEVLEETEVPVKNDSLKQRESPVIKKDKLKKENKKNNLPNQNNPETNNQINPGYRNQPNNNNEMNPGYRNQPNNNNKMNPGYRNQPSGEENEVIF